MTKIKLPLLQIFNLRLFWMVWVFFLAASSCRSIELYERQKNISEGKWERDEKLLYAIEIPDSAADYYIYASIRHTAIYPFRNIWIRMGLQVPGSDSISYQDFNIPLANTEQWLGAGMNDVYERRVRLFGEPVRFGRSGNAVFSLQHIMREDPLPGVLQAGIRIEPVP